jgi:hypothetical protein
LIFDLFTERGFGRLREFHAINLLAGRAAAETVERVGIGVLGPREIKGNRG